MWSAVVASVTPQYAHWRPLYFLLPLISMRLVTHPWNSSNASTLTDAADCHVINPKGTRSQHVDFESNPIELRWQLVLVLVVPPNGDGFRGLRNRLVLALLGTDYPNPGTKLCTIILYPDTYSVGRTRTCLIFLRESWRMPSADGRAL